MRKLAIVIAALLVGCASSYARRLVPCVDGMTVSGALHKGRYDGGDIAVLLGGEADGFDSNYEEYQMGIAFHSAIGKSPERCGSSPWYREKE